MPFTYHVPAGKLTTLCVASQETRAVWIEVAFAAAFPEPVKRLGCVAHGTVYAGIENPALVQSTALEGSRNVDQFCA
jgi:NAD(P)H-flavin reductase